MDAGLLSALVELVLSERLGDCCVVNGSGNFSSEWGSLKKILLFSRSISHKQTSIFSTVRKARPIDSSFA